MCRWVSRTTLSCRGFGWARVEVGSGPFQGGLGAVLGCLGASVVLHAVLGLSLPVLGYFRIVFELALCLSWVLFGACHGLALDLPKKTPKIVEPHKRGAVGPPPKGTQKCVRSHTGFGKVREKSLRKSLMQRYLLTNVRRAEPKP